jgi:hypothetical protein
LTNTPTTYAYPIIGDKQVNEIGDKQVNEVETAEAGIEPSSLSLKIKENFKFENFSISTCTLIGLFQWYDRPSLSYPKLTVATGRDRPKATIR